MSKPSDDAPGGRQQLSDTQSKDDDGNLQSQKYRRPFSLCHVALVNRLDKGKGWDEDKVPGPGPSLSLSQVY